MVTPPPAQFFTALLLLLDEVQWGEGAVLGGSLGVACALCTCGGMNNSR